MEELSLIAIEVSYLNNPHNVILSIYSYVLSKMKIKVSLRSIRSLRIKLTPAIYQHSNIGNKVYKAVTTFDTPHVS